MKTRLNQLFCSNLLSGGKLFMNLFEFSRRLFMVEVRGSRCRKGFSPNVWRVRKAKIFGRKKVRKIRRSTAWQPGVECVKVADEDLKL